MPITRENIDNLFELLANLDAGLPVEGLVRRLGLNDYYIGDRPMHNMASAAIEAFDTAGTELKDALKSSLGVTTESASGISSAPVSGEQVYRFELKIGDKTFGARVTPSKGVELMGIPHIGTVQIDKGITLSINQTSGGN
jgi:hypothetical protein